MPTNRQRIRLRKFQQCVKAFSIIEEAIQLRLGVPDIQMAQVFARGSNSVIDSKLLAPKHVAKTLGLSEKTLANWRCSGTQGLKHIKVGSRIFYRRSDVEAFIQSNSKNSTSDLGGLNG